MDTAVKVMDLDVNIMDTAAFNKKVEGYLENDQLNIMLLATSQLFAEAAEKENLREMISLADTIVPGEEALLSMYPVEILEEGGVIVNYRCLIDLLEYLKKSHYTIYVVARNDKELQTVKDFFRYYEYNISVVGGKLVQEVEDEFIINEINSLVPDVLLIDLDTPLQETWIMEHKTKVNVKLCIGLGGIMKQMIASYGGAPPFLHKLHLGNLYKKFFLNGKWLQVRKGKEFKKKVEEYKDRKRKKE